MRSVSNLVAALVLLAVVVGVGAAVAMLSGALTQRLQPAGAALSIQSVRAQALDERRSSVLVEIVATVTGAQSVRIEKVGLHWDSGYREVDPWAPSKGRFFSPGSTINIVARFDRLSGLEDYEPVRVVVVFCDTQRVCYRAAGSAVLEPYRP